MQQLQKLEEVLQYKWKVDNPSMIIEHFDGPKVTKNWSWASKVYQLLGQLHFKRLQCNVDCEITLALLTHHAKAHQDMFPP